MFCNYISEESQEAAINSFLNLLNRKPEDCLSIDGLLEQVGDYFKADRAFIFEKDDVQPFLKNTFEWCNEGVLTQLESHQEIPVEIVDLWKMYFRRNGSVYVAIDKKFREKNPDTYDILKTQNVDNVIVAPLVLGGKIVGLFGVDNPTKHQKNLLLMSVMASSVFKELLSIREVEKTKIAEAKLKDAMEMAQSANKAKSNFLFNMSHDIRTPMNAIVGYNALIKKDISDSEKVLHYQEKIESSSEFLLSLIDDVLDMARIESGKYILDETYNHIGDNTNAIITVFAAEAKQRKINFKHSILVQHQYILCDNTKIRQIFSNLLSNAVKYTPAGGSICVTTKEIDCPKDGYMTVQTVVEDTGIGISEDFLPYIFEPFTREQNSTKSGVAGTGLGMAIVKKLVDLMGGTIAVESRLGKGTKFTVTITHRLAEQYNYNNATLRYGKDISVFKNKRILLAEDNDMNAEIASTILRDVGFLVDRAEDGVVCVDMLNKASDNYYSMILMDIQMPKMDGYEATRIIRSMDADWKKNIPILALTANAFAEDKKKALTCGMNAHISKPIKIQGLIDVLIEYFN